MRYICATVSRRWHYRLMVYKAIQQGPLLERRARLAPVKIIRLRIKIERADPLAARVRIGVRTSEPRGKLKRPPLPRPTFRIAQDQRLAETRHFGGERGAWVSRHLRAVRPAPSRCHRCRASVSEFALLVRSLP